MYDELETIRVAAQYFAVHHVAAGEPMLEASHTLWSAMYEGDHWSDDLRVTVYGLAEELTRAGSVETTLEQLDDGASEEFAERIRLLAENLKSHAAGAV